MSESSCVGVDDAGPDPARVLAEARRIALLYEGSEAWMLDLFDRSSLRALVDLSHAIGELAKLPVPEGSPLEPAYVRLAISLARVSLMRGLIRHLSRADPYGGLYANV